MRVAALREIKRVGAFVIRVTAFAAAHAPERQLRVVIPHVMDRGGGSRLRVFFGNLLTMSDHPLLHRQDNNVHGSASKSRLHLCE